MIDTATALTKANEKLDSLLEQIDNAKADMVTGVITIGRSLSEAREILAGKGEFLGWVEANCGFSQRTAYNYLDAFEVFGTFAKFANIQDSALYVLAKSEPAAKKAKELANRGQRITHEKAKELVEEAKAAAKTTPAKPAPAAPSSPAPSPEPPKPDATATETHAYTCPNCQGHEQDDDGDCAKCHEPAAESEPESEPSGGYEPIEAKKHLDKLADLIAKAAREHAEAVKILGPSEAMGTVFSGLDTASIALTKFRNAFKRKVK